MEWRTGRLQNGTKIGWHNMAHPVVILTWMFWKLGKGYNMKSHSVFVVFSVVHLKWLCTCIYICIWIYVCIMISFTPIVIRSHLISNISPNLSPSSWSISTLFSTCDLMVLPPNAAPSTSEWRPWFQGWMELIGCRWFYVIRYELVRL